MDRKQRAEWQIPRHTPGRTCRSRASWALLLLTLACAGCNIFSPVHTPGTSGDVDDLMSDTRDALQRGLVEDARRYADRALEIAPLDERVRYLHAVVVSRYFGVDVASLYESLVRSDSASASYAAGTVLNLDPKVLGAYFEAFGLVIDDLAPLVDRMRGTGHELRRVPQSADVFLSYGLALTVRGLLRMVDNDSTANVFSADTTLSIVSTPVGFILALDPSIVDPVAIDRIIDDAINAGWPLLSDGREALYRYYRFVTDGIVFSNDVPPLPAPLPTPVDGVTVSGEIVSFVDDGARVLFRLKEDLP